MKFNLAISVGVLALLGLLGVTLAEMQTADTQAGQDAQPAQAERTAAAESPAPEESGLSLRSCLQPGTGSRCRRLLCRRTATGPAARIDQRLGCSRYRSAAGSRSVHSSRWDHGRPSELYRSQLRCCWCRFPERW